jgi:hypothetical protein
LVGDLEHGPRLELILPLCLFNWNPNDVQLPFGATTIPPSALYPLTIRSWDRLFNPDFRYTRHQWHEKWRNRPEEKLGSAHVHCLFDAAYSCETLRDNLLPQQRVLVFLALFRLSGGDRGFEDLFSTALAAGLPFMFWPIHWPLDARHPDFQTLRRHILNWIRRTDVMDWPEKLFGKRRPCKRKSKKVQPDWNDLMLLWDDAEHLPPPLQHRLQSPEE